MSKCKEWSLEIICLTLNTKCKVEDHTSNNHLKVEGNNRRGRIVSNEVSWWASRTQIFHKKLHVFVYCNWKSLSQAYSNLANFLLSRLQQLSRLVCRYSSICRPAEFTAYLESKIVFFNMDSQRGTKHIWVNQWTLVNGCMKDACMGGRSSLLLRGWRREVFWAMHT